MDVFTGRAIPPFEMLLRVRYGTARRTSMGFLKISLVELTLSLAVPVAAENVLDGLIGCLLLCGSVSSSSCGFECCGMRLCRYAGQDLLCVEKTVGPCYLVFLPIFGPKFFANLFKFAQARVDGNNESDVQGTYCTILVWFATIPYKSCMYCMYLYVSRSSY